MRRYNMLRKLKIKMRSFYVLYIKNQRSKSERLTGAELWNIYANEMVKMRTSQLRKLGII